MSFRSMATEEKVKSAKRLVIIRILKIHSIILRLAVIRTIQ